MFERACSYGLCLLTGALLTLIGFHVGQDNPHCQRGDALPRLSAEISEVQTIVGNIRADMREAKQCPCKKQDRKEHK